MGEIPRYFDDGVNALIAAPGDAAAYAEKLIEALDDPEAAAAVGSEGRRLCETTFDYRAHGTALREFFASLAGQPAIPQAKARPEATGVQGPGEISRERP